jgi:hypothetical protein
MTSTFTFLSSVKVMPVYVWGTVFRHIAEVEIHIFTISEN